MEEPKELLYETPKMSTLRRLFASFLFFSFFIPLTFTGIWLILSPFYFDMAWNALIIGFIVVPIGVITSIMIFLDLSYPNFRIYNQGISPLLTPITPFSKLSYNKKITNWSEIKCFDRYGHSKKHPQIILYMPTEEYPSGKATYSHPRIEVIERLITEMEKHGVKEISTECSQCEKETYGSSLICPYCKNDRYNDSI